MEASSALDTEIRVIEIHMMDTFKFYPLTITTGLAVRGLIYPMTLIRTRLQSQSGKAVYKGTVDAFLKISRDRGLRGLYRGFGVSCFQSVSSVVYLYSYENVRRWLSQSLKDSHYCSMLAGGAASCVNQCFIVPLDVISQHLMLIETKRPGTEKQIEQKLQTLQHIQLSEEVKNSRFGAVKGICQEIYRLNGLKGFYKGYLISLGVYMPSSMCWWFFYDRYGGLMVDMLPDVISRMLIHMGAASLAAISTSILTNPLDLLRTRVQVRGESIRTSLNILWREEGLLGCCTKALPARVTSSIIFSLFIATGYESVKRFSLKEEYKGDVRW